MSDIWNEAWIAGRGWQPVDATFGQVHADATHLKLLEGEQTGDLVPLVGLVGKLRVASLSASVLTCFPADSQSSRTASSLAARSGVIAA